MRTPITIQVERRMGTPIVFKRAKKSGKKSRKPRLKDATQAEKHLYRAAERTVDAADKSLRRYKKASRASARRERDGALIDFVPNATRGMVVGAARIAPVPLDLLRAGWTGSTRRATRGSVRAVARILERS